MSYIQQVHHILSVEKGDSSKVETEVLPRGSENGRSVEQHRVNLQREHLSSNKERDSPSTSYCRLREADFIGSYLTD